MSNARRIPAKVARWTERLLSLFHTEPTIKTASRDVIYIDKYGTPVRHEKEYTTLKKS